MGASRNMATFDLRTSSSFPFTTLKQPMLRKRGSTSSFAKRSAKRWSIDTRHWQKTRIPLGREEAFSVTRCIRSVSEVFSSLQYSGRAGRISVTERVGVIARVRALAVGIAKAWVDQQGSEKSRNEIDAGEADDEPAPAAKKQKREPRPAPVA